jgi:outer membrane usher protein FimD/PapC
MKLNLLIILTLLFSPLCFSKDNSALDAFYKKAFSKKKQSSEIFLPLVVNGIQHTEVFAKINNNSATISKENIDYILSLIKPSFRKKFIISANKNNFIPIKELNQYGVSSTFDKEKVYIKITIPPKLKKAELIHFKRNNVLNSKGAVLPENYSGGVNLFLNHNYVSNSTEASGNSALAGSSELFFNAHGFVVEGRISFDKNRAEPFARERVRLVKDDEEHHIRYQVGDIFLPQHGRLAIEDGFGFGFEKIFGMDDDYLKNVSRVNSYEFFLKNSSRVEIYVNRRYTKGIHLNAGTHNLYDLNIPNGLSSIQLKIIEDSGKIEYIDFNDFDYSELYKVGVSKYGGGIGIVARSNELGKRIYYKDQRYLSLYGEYGLFSSLTIKTGLQVKQDYQSFALEPIIGTPIGLFDLYAISSKETLYGKNGTKFGLSYITNFDSLNFSFLAENTTEDFTTLTSYQINEDTFSRKLYQANLYTPLIAGVNLNLGISQYEEKEKKQQYTIELSKAFTQNFDVLLNYTSGSVFTGENIPQKEIFLALNYRFGNNTAARYEHSFQAKEDLLNVTHRTDGYYNIATNLDIQNTPLTQGIALRNDIRNEKFRFSTNYTNTKPNNASGNTQNISSQLSTSLLFAGNSWTISEPMSSSFIIVDNNPLLHNSPLGIKGYQESDDYIFDSFAIQGSDYRTQKFSVNEENLDMGINLTHSTQTFFNKYRSGSKMDIKVKSLFSLQGKLIDQKNQPIALRAFKVFNISSGKKEMLFTNDNGEFILEDVEDGQYNALLFRKKNENGTTRFSFTVNKKKVKKNENLIDIGTIKVTLSKKKLKKMIKK